MPETYPTEEPDLSYADLKHHFNKLFDDKQRLMKEKATLDQVRLILREYHAALNHGQHGPQALAIAFGRIEDALNMRWRPPS